VWLLALAVTMLLMIAIRDGQVLLVGAGVAALVVVIVAARVVAGLAAVTEYMAGAWAEVLFSNREALWSRSGSFRFR
jgi:hypothetical protein